MQKIAIAIAVLLVAGERAEACPDAAWIPDEVGYAFGLAIAGGYAGGIAYFGDHDLANDRNDRDYVTGDIAFNGLFTALWATGTVSALEEHSGYAVPLAGLTALHGACSSTHRWLRAPPTSRTAQRMTATAHAR